MSKVYNIAAKRITEIPFHFLLNEQTAHLLEGLNARSDWLLPQALETINKTLLLVRTGAGLIHADDSILATKETLGSDEFKWFGGLIKYLTQDIRGSIVGKLTQNKHPQYSALVPLVLSALKIYRKVGYEEWDLKAPHLRGLVNPSLLECMKCSALEVSKEELIFFRQSSQLVKTGATKGNIRDITSFFNINRTGNTEFDALPKLMKIILCQTWVAHPSIRTDLMILSVPNLDSMPEPLLEGEINISKYEEKEDFWSKLTK